MTIKVKPSGEAAIKRALDESGALDGENVIAAGHLRQGKPPSMAALFTGTAVTELVRPRRTKQLPRQFVLAVTDNRVIAFKASGGSGEHGPYQLRIGPTVKGSWPRDGIRISGLEEGAQSRGGNLHLGSETIPFFRPNMTGDPSTEELLEVLSS